MIGQGPVGGGGGGGGGGVKKRRKIPCLFSFVT